MNSYLNTRYGEWRNRRRISNLARQIAVQKSQETRSKPLVFFNASTRLQGLSLNAAFSLLSSWSLRLTGIPVVHYVCRSGMSHCVLGTNRADYKSPPPCKACIAQSRRLYAGSNIHWFEYKQDDTLTTEIRDLGINELSNFEYLATPSPTTRDSQSKSSNSSLPFGRLVLPSVRWALRRHNLPDDDKTRYLMREYIISAYNIAREFAAFIDDKQPFAALIFNGIMYPEAIARWVAQNHDIRVITHEVGFQPFSGFFTDGDATAYPIHIPDKFELNPEQNERLDVYLEQRFQGKFTMAGIRFWPEMRGLDEVFQNKAAQFQQIVPVFTNVVYDTSQVHANHLFPHMFVWLDLVLDLIHLHPETLFIIRAHPDEMRPGTRKQSRESVRDWGVQNGVNDLSNVIYIDSQEYISSYELVQRAKFVMVYNSSIGMEAALMDVPVLCGGKARYTQYPTVFFPESPQELQKTAEHFLNAEKIEVPPEFQHNARRFLYYQLYRASLPFNQYLQTGSRLGFVQLKPFSWSELLPENSTTMQVIRKGIINGTFAGLPVENGDRFLLPAVQ
jgi:hypothetical protein